MELMVAHTPTDLLRWIILLPLLGAVINGCVLRSKNGTLSGVVATLASFSAFLVSVVAISKYGQGLALDQWFTWFETGSFKVPFHLEYTPLTSIMLLVVTGIGSLIHTYAIGYMSHDESPWRFFTYLNLFLAAMLVLVLSSGLVGIFMGWEGVGLCSYLLIGYWYKKGENTAAGMKAFVANRVGDLGFLLALFMLGGFVGSFEIREIIKVFAEPNGTVPPYVWMVVCFGLFWASTGKSAQIPLYVWLPDAMAGPTPVSALIHAATMVTSGIFVTTRMWPVFASQHVVLDVIAVIGIATAWLAAMIAFTQRDIKKVLAYSTVSQLGFMFAAIGLGNPTAAFFHVVTHACFKALLFLGAGSVIHGMHEKQDLYEMGHLKSHMKHTHWTFLVATLAIIGFPLTAGFFSKDMILGIAFEHNKTAYVFLLMAALMTAFYMLRCYSLAFHGKARSKEAEHAHESPWIMTVPLIVLAVLTCVIGWIETPAVIGGIHFLKHLLEASWYGAVPQLEHHEPLSHGAEAVLILFTTACSLGVAWFSYKKYANPAKEIFSEQLSLPEKMSQNKFFVDEIYDFIFIQPLSQMAKWGTWLFDTILINGTLHLFRDTARVSGQLLSVLHTGNVQTYALYLVLGAGVLLALIKVVVQ